MIDDLKSYPEYRDSGIPWVEQVPRHWQVEPGFAAFREKQEKNTGLAEKRVLSLSYGRIVVKPEDKLHGLVPESFETYQIVNPGDIIIRSTDLQNDWNSLRVGLVRDRGIITSAYICLKMVGPLIPEYGYLQLHALDLMKVFYGMGTGLRQNLSFSDFKRMPVIIPSPEEQTSMVRFLSHANRQIENYISAKKNLITLLNEQKQVIINQAVTRGLNPHVSFKKSGIPWIGNIPKNFSRTQLKRVCLSIRDGTHNPPPAVPGVHRLLSVRNIVKGQFVTRDDDRTMTPQAFAELQRSYTVEKGDIVIALVGGTTGKSAVAGEMANVTVQRSLGIIRPNPALMNSCFLNLLITSEVIQSQIRMIMVKYAAQPGIYLLELGGLQILYPPVHEQKEIVEYVGAQTKELDESVKTIESEIALLREYKTRLITDVVAGRLDVRETAGQLPVEEMSSLNGNGEENTIETEFIDTSPGEDDE